MTVSTLTVVPEATASGTAPCAEPTTAAARGPMRFAYADPPYLGQAAKHYRHARDYHGEVDHASLIAELVRDFPDGWALSASTPSLRILLPLCPPTIRVMAWVKPFCAFKKGINPAYAWEPVLVHGGRQHDRDTLTVRDWVAASITTRRGVPGAKPDPFCFWLFEVLGAQPTDELVDLFPGSGAVASAWQRWRQQTRLHPRTGRSQPTHTPTLFDDPAGQP